MTARIYRPARNAMQSGQVGSQTKWMLEYSVNQPTKRDPLMGWPGNGDMKTQVKLSFSTLEEAKKYAQKHKINAVVVPDNQKRNHKIRALGYGENFRNDRAEPWTH